MYQRSICGLLMGVAVLSAGVLAGCSSIDRSSHRLVNAITPYQIEVVQGNFVSNEQVQALKPGMSHEQVRDILGSPLVTSVFHADRWDYVFTIKRKGLTFEEKKLTVFFSGFVMERVEGDEMPSESEFVAILGAQNNKPKIPKLEATPEQLERFAPAKKAESGADASDSDAQPAVQPRGSYPPLE
ncbi:outer membrane protein assembly factor BamE [Lampropedia puyangensis]|uniref:Outer membrane protein assembly factor BamE n=1 Tax=Lampropedia puyangensis TaxID=1330072 RepID=A0A4S8F110_9BURK|nr:outer membrane protein assembly factor BamE [Lampropedia puyangensis]THU00301.1 outer membrane protein assembly factor BamE [Lampropedia puyangensis]